MQNKTFLQVLQNGNKFWITLELASFPHSYTTLHCKSCWKGRLGYKIYLTGEITNTLARIIDCVAELCRAAAVLGRRVWRPFNYSLFMASLPWLLSIIDTVQWVEQQLHLLLHGATEIAYYKTRLFLSESIETAAFRFLYLSLRLKPAHYQLGTESNKL